MTNQNHEVIHIEEGKLTPQRVESAIRRLPIQTQQRMDGIQAMVAIDEVSHAIAECTTIELGKYLDNKIDALAALAKILKDDKLTVAAKRAKLENYRKLGELAESLRPTKTLKESHPHKISNSEAQKRYKARKKGIELPSLYRGIEKGANSLLVEHGFTGQKPTRILQISKIPEEKFKEMVSSPNPPGIKVASLAGKGLSKMNNTRTSSEAYRKFVEGNCGFCGHTVRAFCRKNDAKELARGMELDEAVKAREIVIEIQEWLDTFERHLPKELK
jgi:hypothetical protein